MLDPLSLEHIILLFKYFFTDLESSVFKICRVKEREVWCLKLIINHGVSMKLSGGIDVFSLYSVSNSKIWVFAVRLIGDHGGYQALKLMKCAVIDCCFPIFEIRVLFGFLILGEENGVRVFPLRPLVKGKQRKEKKSGGKRLNLQSGSSNGGKTLATDGESNLLSVKGMIRAKLRFVKLRQDSKGTGGVFVAFKDKDFNGSVLVKISGKSVKTISVAALSATKFVIVDSVGNLHVLCLSSSLHGLDTGCVMRQSTQTMKVYKMAVFHDDSTVTQTAWISDGCYTVHLMAVSGLDASVDEFDVEDTDEKLVKISGICCTLIMCCYINMGKHTYSQLKGFDLMLEQEFGSELDLLK